MKVLKFGGTSVGTVESLRNVKAIVESQPQPVMVVVSALGGLTDRLIATANDAAGGVDPSQAVEAFALRHRQIIDELVPEAGRRLVQSAVDRLIGGLDDAYRRILAMGKCPEEVMDEVVAFGERMSSHIVTAMFGSQACRYNSLDFIRTFRPHGRHLLDVDATETLLHRQFEGFEAGIAVVPGFISRDSSTGAITNLGRGGSDFTAAILAASFNAEVLEIWTDVDGFMTADPRIIKDATVVPTMTFVEAMELCNFGAKVIYPPTIYPVFHKNIPIIIKNTFNPSALGTFISDPEEVPGIVRPSRATGVSSIKDTTLISLCGDKIGRRKGIRSRMFNTLAACGVNVFLGWPDKHLDDVVTFAVKGTDTADAVAALRDELLRDLSSGNIKALESHTGLATVALVGDNLRHDPSIAERLGNALRGCFVEIVAEAKASTDSSIAFTVAESDLQSALAAVHYAFFSPPIPRIAHYPHT